MFKLKMFFMNEAGAEGQQAGGAAQQADPAQAAQQQSQSWYSGFDEPTRGYIEAKGFKDPGAVVTSYQNLEKLMGHDRAGRTVVLPKDEADVDAFNTIYDKLGRPATPDDYKLPVPEGDKGEFAKTAAGWFHEAGLTSKQASMLAEKFNEHGGGLAQNHQADLDQKRDADFATLEREWGDQFQSRAEIARRAMREVGLSPEQGAALEDTIGVAAAAKMFEQFGKMMSEHGSKGFENAGGSSFGTTPAEAKHQINQLTQDKAWQQRYFNGGALERNEMERLQKLAYPS